MDSLLLLRRPKKPPCVLQRRCMRGARCDGQQQAHEKPRGPCGGLHCLCTILQHSGSRAPWRAALCDRSSLSDRWMQALINAKAATLSGMPKEAIRSASHNYLHYIRNCHKRALRTLQSCLMHAAESVRSVWYRWQSAHVRAGGASHPFGRTTHLTYTSCAEYLIQFAVGPLRDGLGSELLSIRPWRNSALATTARVPQKRGRLAASRLGRPASCGSTVPNPAELPS